MWFCWYIDYDGTEVIRNVEQHEIDEPFGIIDNDTFVDILVSY